MKKKNEICETSGLLQKIDQFSSNAEFQEGGNENFRTWYGGLISLAIFIVISFYGTARAIIFATRGDDNVSIFIEKYVLEREKDFNLADIGQAIGFRLNIYDENLKPQLLDDRYVHYSAGILEINFESGEDFLYPLDFHICDESDAIYFADDMNMEDWNYWVNGTYYCFDDPS